LHRTKAIKKISEELELNLENMKRKLSNIRDILFEYRERRIHPGKDDKILADWNGLMIAALAKGGKILGEKTYIETAKNAFNFINVSMRDNESRLLHRYRDGKAEIRAFVDDYSFLIWSALELFEATHNADYLKAALKLNKEFIEYFWDDNIGGFYFTANDSEELIVRHKEIYDGAIPSGNSVAMLNLIRLSYITGEPELERKAQIINRVFSEKVADNPIAFTQLLVSIDFSVGPSYNLVISGDEGSKDTQELLTSINNHYLPNLTVIFRPTDAEIPPIAAYVDCIRNYHKKNEKATAYVCEDKSCRAPTNNPKIMLNSIRAEWDL
ncbi:MAG: thioredoxin domain-containing protein, partial [Promethearchaeota archaeon]